MMSFKDFLLETLSGRGLISAKRVFGAFILTICMLCIIFLVIRDGGTVVVENLLETAMFVSLGLLGISNVTAIWKWDKQSGSNRYGPTDSYYGSTDYYREPEQRLYGNEPYYENDNNRRNTNIVQDDQHIAEE